MHKTVYRDQFDLPVCIWFFFSVIVNQVRLFYKVQVSLVYFREPQRQALMLLVNGDCMSAADVWEFLAGASNIAILDFFFF